MPGNIRRLLKVVRPYSDKSFILVINLPNVINLANRTGEPRYGIRVY